MRIASRLRNGWERLRPLPRPRYLANTPRVYEDAPEGVVARAALDAGLWGIARDHLTGLPDADISPKVCHMMAELEEREHGNMAEARKWLNRAVFAGEGAEQE